MSKLLTAIFLPMAMYASSTYGSEVIDTATIQKALKFDRSAETRRILVDNINGSISVTGYDGNEVRLVAYRTIRAESDRKIEEAKEKVTLDIKEDFDRIVVYVDAPWRDRDGGVNYHGRDYYGYDVIYDFTLMIPSKTNFLLKTINHGRITAANLNGNFDVSNVNGSIDMQNIEGSGKVSTINGNVEVKFRENPTSQSSFTTINGKVDVEFRNKLSANLRLKTMNGRIYSDFPVKNLSQPAILHENHGRKRLYSREDSFTVQAGNGGPDFSFETLNGNIYITENND